MAKRTGPTNPITKRIVIALEKAGRKERVNLWKRIAYELQRPRRQRREANLSKINKYARENEIALVPGKVLSNGQLTKKITVAALSFSKSAEEKINKIGKAITIQQLLRENPKARRVRIIG
ncbi:MAG: 50S ribosomal protein L18e [Nanoarchaeota archaeon]